MKFDFRHKQALVATAVLFAGSVAFAQTSLTQPNNSAGTAIDTPPLMTSPLGATTTRDTPTRTENSLSAFDKLDPSHRGYVTQAEVNQLPGNINFSEADRNHDGRLDQDEFQRFWNDYQGQHN